MKTLNLVYPEKSDIKYKISKFPDGQQNIVVGQFTAWNKWVEEKYYSDDKVRESKRYIEQVIIKSRLNNWLDLELIVCAVASLRELDVEEIHLYAPYIMGARSDRKFEEGGNNYLKDVICPIINSLNFKTVTCIDPHSDVLEACIKNFRKKSNEMLVRFAIREIYKESKSSLINNGILVSPDAGANKKIYKLAEQIGYKGDIITCSKDRDKNGKLTKTIIPNYEFNKDIIIIDDICDGGNTFINIAKILKSDTDFKGKIYLIVTHGIFSKGFDELSEYFDGIYCTNSYKGINDYTEGYDYHDFPKEKTKNKKLDFIKQLDVF